MESSRTKMVSRRLLALCAMDYQDLRQEEFLRPGKGTAIDCCRKYGWFGRSRVRLVDMPTLATRSHESEVIASVDASRLLANLCESQRRAVELHFMAGMRERELSDVLGISVSLVRNRCGRGIEKMRKYAQVI